MENAKKIIVVDGVGTGRPELFDDPEYLPLYLPIFSLKELQNKIFALSSVKPDDKKFMAVYHSELDDLSQVKEKYLDLSAQKLIKSIQ